MEVLLALPLSDKKFIGTFYREYENYSGNFFMRNALRMQELGGVRENLGADKLVQVYDEKEELNGNS